MRYTHVFHLYKIFSSFTASEILWMALFSPIYPQVDSVLGDGLPTIEDVKKLKYTTRVINEVRN
jgi:hypothetical protein